MVQAEGVVSGAETKRWRSSWAAAAEAQWVAAGQGKFKESAAQFLSSSWQGDALSVSQHREAWAMLGSCGQLTTCAATTCHLTCHAVLLHNLQKHSQLSMMALFMG